MAQSAIFNFFNWCKKETKDNIEMKWGRNMEFRKPAEIQVKEFDQKENKETRVGNKKKV